MRLKSGQKMVTFEERVKWIRPVTLEELIEQKSINPGAKIVFGNTEVGVETKLKGQFYPIMIYAGDISQLDYIREVPDRVQFGAGVCLTDMKKYCKESSDQGLQTVYEMLRWFAGTQIRNAASWAGNVATASPISDLNPVWCVLDAKLMVASKEGDRSLDMNNFFLGYRKTALQTPEVITAIQIRNRRKGEFVMAYKQSKRRDDDIAIVNAAFCVELDDENRVIQCRMAFGGMGPMTIVSKTASTALIGQIWTNDGVAEETTTNLQTELALASDAVGGMTDYRNALVSSFFFKFYLHVAMKIGMQLAKEQVSAIVPRKIIPYTSTQIHPSPEDKKFTGQAIPHLSALKHSTGTAQYVDDLPQIQGELHAGLLLSSQGHAKILSLDMEPAYAVPGVVKVITWKDVRGKNQIGPVFEDERVFVEDKVTSCGQIVAMVLAEDQRTAQRAARLIKVEYEDLPLILTIDVVINVKLMSVGGH
jgi:xanthine dehydrogenase/oxidase